MRRVIHFALAVVAVLTLGSDLPAAEPALHEVNAYRARRGLPPFREDPALTAAACRAADIRAAHRIAGHLNNGAGDYACLSPGVRCDATGCAAWPPHLGWGSCCMDDPYEWAGAAFAVGADGLRYMHLFVRNGPPVAGAAAPVAAMNCPCGPGCGCAPGACPAGCPRESAYTEITRRCKAGERFVKAVAAGDVPGVPAGTHTWYALPDGNIRCDFGVSPAPAVRLAAPTNPFAVPGCATCAPGRR